MRKLVRILGICLLVFSFLSLSACTSSKDFIGTWETDLFDSKNTLGASKDIAKGGAESMFGSLEASLVGLFADMLSYNVTMEIREDGTVIVDSGEIFYATWRQEGNKIIIDGDNIYGTATLSSDKNTLYFENTLGPSLEKTTGLNLGTGSLNFEFTRIE